MNSSRLNRPPDSVTAPVANPFEDSDSKPRILISTSTHLNNPISSESLPASTSLSRRIGGITKPSRFVDDAQRTTPVQFNMTGTITPASDSSMTTATTSTSQNKIQSTNELRGGSKGASGRSKIHKQVTHTITILDSRVTGELLQEGTLLSDLPPQVTSSLQIFDPPSSVNNPAIAGGVIGGIFFLALLLVILRRCTQGPRETDEERAERELDESIAHQRSRSREDVFAEVQDRARRRRQQAREKGLRDVDPVELATAQGWETGPGHGKFQSWPPHVGSDHAVKVSPLGGKSGTESTKPATWVASFAASHIDGAQIRGKLASSGTLSPSSILSKPSAGREQDDFPNLSLPDRLASATDHRQSDTPPSDTPTFGPYRV